MTKISPGFTYNSIIHSPLSSSGQVSSVRLTTVFRAETTDTADEAIRTEKSTRLREKVGDRITITIIMSKCLGPLLEEFRRKTKIESKLQVNCKAVSKEVSRQSVLLREVATRVD